MTSKVAEAQSAMAAPARLVDEHRAAAFLGLSVKTLRGWRWRNKELPFVKLGAAVRYDMRDLENYIEANRCGCDRRAA